MEYRDDELKKDIDAIKSDISILKLGVTAIVQHLNLDIPIQGLEIDTDVQESLVSTASGTGDHTVTQDAVTEPEMPSTSTAFFLIDPSFARDEEVRRIVIRRDKDLQSCKRRGNFIEFCYYATSLVEDFVKRFIERKFQELLEEENRDLIEGYSLLESEYQKDKRSLKDVYVQRSDKLKICRRYPNDEEKFYLDTDKDKYLFLTYLKQERIYILTELCFAVMYKSDFYRQKNRPRYSSSGKSSQSQSSYSALQRPTPKSKVESNKLQIKYYYKLSSAREFRNVYEHNKDNRVNQNEEIERLKGAVKADFEQYDVILEATQWFIHQL